MGSETGLGATLRAELNALFGIRWDSFVEWAVITWLSIWFWITAFAGGLSGVSPLQGLAADDRFVGPLSGIASFLQGIGTEPPGWFSDVLTWLHAPEHGWMYWVALLASVLTCVTSSRDYKHTGLRVLALVSAAVACEVHGDLWPVLWVILMAGVPALVACSLDWVDRLRETSKYGEHRYYFAEGILIRFITGIVFLFLKVPVAPIVILGQLVVSFRTEIPRYAGDEITREVARSLEEVSEEGEVKVDALAQAASAAAISLAGNQSPEAREILGHYSYLLRKRRDRMNAESRRRANESQRITELRYRNYRSELRGSYGDESLR